MNKLNNVKNKLIITISVLVLFASSMTVMASKAVISAGSAAEKQQKPAVTKTVQPTDAVKKSETSSAKFNKEDYTDVKPLDVVAKPDEYLNKKVKFKTSFDKFSVLGLDYKPALRDSQKYITFLIKRDDVPDHTIPLSEMKIFIKRAEAEKFIDLDSGDIIEVYGTVFSNALTDAWVDVDKLVVVQKIKKDKEKKAA